MIDSKYFHVQLPIMDLLLFFASVCAPAQEVEADGKLKQNNNNA